MMSTAVGQDSLSIPTAPATSRLAAVTNLLPGPTILSTRGTVCVPNVSAAIDCGPPIRRARVTPASSAAASTASVIPPGGVTITISGTPATVAGTTFLITVEG